MRTIFKLILSFFIITSLFADGYYNDLADPGGLLNKEYYYDIVVDGNVAYVSKSSNAKGTITALDITDPENPVFLSEVTDLGDGVERFEKDGNYLYVAADQDGLYIINVTDPNNIILESHLGFGVLQVNSVAIDGNVLYVGIDDDSVGGGSGKIQKVDITDKSTPVTIGAISDSMCSPTGGDFGMYRMDFDGTYLHAACGQDGYVSISFGVVAGTIDLEGHYDPSDEYGWNDFDDLGQGVVYQNGYAFYVDKNRLYILDVGNGSDGGTIDVPVEKSHYEDLTWPAFTDIVISGTFAYLSSDDGVHQIDISDLDNPTFVWKKLYDTVQSLDYKDGYIYAASDSGINMIPALGSKKWEYQTGDDIFISSPAIADDGTVYIGSQDDKLYALNPNGSLKWTYTTGDDIQSSPSIGSDGTIYVASYDHKLYAISPDGEKIWEYDIGSWTDASPAIGSDGTIYIGSATGILYAVNPNGIQKWTIDLGAEIFRSVAIGVDGTIYLASADIFYAINPDGTLKWSNSTFSWAFNQSAPAIAKDGTIYIGSDANRLYAINPDGSDKWNKGFTSNVRSSFSIASDGTIYVAAGAKALYALNSDGTTKWVFDDGGGGSFDSTPAIGSDGTIYVGTEDNHLYAVNPDGTKKWKYTTGGGIYNSPAIADDGTICFGSSDGKVYALRSESEGYQADSYWPKFKQNNKNTGIVNRLVNKKWEFETSIGIYLSSPAIDNEVVYIGSQDDNLYAIYKDTGLQKWAFTTGGNVESTPSIGSDGTIYVGSDDSNKLYAINPDDGTEKWNFIMGGRTRSAPAIGSDGTVYVGSNDFKLYAINPENGTQKWNFTTGDSIGDTASPIIGNDGTIYIGSNDDKLYAVNSEDGTEKWSFTTLGDIYASPAISEDGVIYIGSNDHKLYAINPEDGTKNWEFDAGDGIWTSPIVGSDGTIYVSSSTILYAINSNGTQKWVYDVGDWITSTPTIGSDNIIYIGSYDSKLYAINSLDGSLEFVFSSEDEIYSSPVIDEDGTLYFGSKDDKLYAIETNSLGYQEGSPWPKFQNNSKNTGAIGGGVVPGPANNPPIATNDTANTNQDTSVLIPVLENDRDPDVLDILIITNVDNPDNGNAVIIGNEIQYTPDAQYSGTDTFIYTISDGNGGIDTATVTVSINGIPVANNDTIAVRKNENVLIPVLENDTDSDVLDILTVTNVGNAVNGTTAISNNEILYTPNDDYVGEDTFIYTISDGNGGTDTATVIVTVFNNNIENVTDINLNDNKIFENDINGTVVGITAQAVDNDGDDITYHIIDENNDEITNGAFAINQTTGIVTINDTSLIDFETNPSPNIIIQARSVDGSNSTKVFTITIEDIDELQVNIINLNLEEKNIVDIVAVSEDGTEISILNIVLINGDNTIITDLLPYDAPYSLKFVVDSQAQIKNYWYRFSDSKLYLEQIETTGWDFTLNGITNSLTLDLATSNWIDGLAIPQINFLYDRYRSSDFIPINVEILIDDINKNSLNLSIDASNNDTIDFIQSISNGEVDHLLYFEKPIILTLMPKNSNSFGVTTFTIILNGEDGKRKSKSNEEEGISSSFNLIVKKHDIKTIQNIITQYDYDLASSSIPTDIDNGFFCIENYLNKNEDLYECNIFFRRDMFKQNNLLKREVLDKDGVVTLLDLENNYYEINNNIISVYANNSKSSLLKDIKVVSQKDINYLNSIYPLYGMDITFTNSNSKAYEVYEHYYEDKLYIYTDVWYRDKKYNSLDTFVEDFRYPNNGAGLLRNQNDKTKMLLFGEGNNLIEIDENGDIINEVAGTWNSSSVVSLYPQIQGYEQNVAFTLSNEVVKRATYYKKGEYYSKLYLNDEAKEEIYKRLSQNPKITIPLNHGWTYISLYNNKSLCDEDIISLVSSCDQENTLESIFGINSSIKYLLKNTAIWSYWDKDNGPKPHYQIGKFSELNQKEGLLIRTNATTTIDIPFDGLNKHNTNIITPSKSGWFLTGVDGKRTVEDIQLLIEQKNKILQYILLFRNNNWLIYAPLNDQMIDSSIQRLEEVDSMESFWIMVE